MLAGTTPTGATLEVEEGAGTLGTLRNLLVTVHTGSKRDLAETGLPADAGKESKVEAMPSLEGVVLRMRQRRAMVLQTRQLREGASLLREIASMECMGLGRNSLAVVPTRKRAVASAMQQRQAERSHSKTPMEPEGNQRRQR
jgi:hypothetical protein